MNETDFPAKIRSRMHPLTIIGALVWGGYPGDSKVRKGFGVVALLCAGISALWLALRDGQAYERKAAAENVAAMVTANAAVVEAISEQTAAVTMLAAEIKAEGARADTFRQAWFATMGERVPQPKPVRAKVQK